MSSFHLQSIAYVPDTKEFCTYSLFSCHTAWKKDIIVFILQIRKLMLREVVTWLSSPRDLVTHLASGSKAIFKPIILIGGIPPKEGNTGLYFKVIFMKPGKRQNVIKTDQKNRNKGHHKGKHTHPLSSLKPLINYSGLVQMVFLFQGNKARHWL